MPLNETEIREMDNHLVCTWAPRQERIEIHLNDNHLRCFQYGICALNYFHFESLDIDF